MLFVRKFDPEKHHRRSYRLKDYDYSQAGMYFITICTAGRDCLFGRIENGKMVFNSFGQIARDEWLKTTAIRSEIELGECIIMPNHVHGIVIINENGNVGAYGNTPPFENTNNDSGGVPNDAISIGAYGNTPPHDDTNNDSGGVPNDAISVGAYGNTPPFENTNNDSGGKLNETDSFGALNDAGLVGAYGHTPLRSTSKTVGAMVRGYKSAVTKQINVLRNTPKNPVWQRNYHDHIIRNAESFLKISDYIRNNPLSWEEDDFYR